MSILNCASSSRRVDPCVRVRTRTNQRSHKQVVRTSNNTKYTNESRTQELFATKSTENFVQCICCYDHVCASFWLFFKTYRHNATSSAPLYFDVADAKFERMFVMNKRAAATIKRMIFRRLESNQCEYNYLVFQHTHSHIGLAESN